MDQFNCAQNFNYYFSELGNLLTDEIINYS